jgi:hypothetical protein
VERAIVSQALHTSYMSLTAFVDFQLDAQNSYLLICNTFIKSFTCFDYYSAQLQEVYVVIVYMQPLVSLHSAGEGPVHRLRKK